jgi:hypothetical protein
VARPSRLNIGSSLREAASTTQSPAVGNADSTLTDTAELTLIADALGVVTESGINACERTRSELALGVDQCIPARRMSSTGHH